MYVNQIDNIIDNLLNRYYIELVQDKTFRTIVDQKKLNFVEYKDGINGFIKRFAESIDISEIQKLINNRENLQQILNIISRYLAYYYFLSMAYYYSGSLKDYRNNIIQYSKLQEISQFTIRDFFDSANNYRLVQFFNLLKDVDRVILMTDLQKKTLNYREVKDAIDFLNRWGADYVNNFLLTVIDDRVEVNVHNLIKTIVFGEIYQKEERNTVFAILNETEDDEKEYIYIEIVVNTEDIADFNTLKEVIRDSMDVDADLIALDIIDMLDSSRYERTDMTIDEKNNNLISFEWNMGIVDDFLRYHRDSERIENEMDKNIIIPSGNNAKNVQLALLYQQRKKKENTKAQLIVNRVDVVSDLYSDIVKSDENKTREIKKLFYPALSHRKVVMTNYLEEVRVMNKIVNQGKRAMEGNEYFLELRQINGNAYFNFKDFQNQGLSLMINVPKAINFLRQSNIDSIKQMSNQEVELRTATHDMVVSLTGLSLGPFDTAVPLCVKKQNLANIREIEITYIDFKGGVKKFRSDNGMKMYLRIIKYFIIKPIIIKSDPIIDLDRDDKEIRGMNKSIYSKIIYWLYDTKLDTFNMDTYENINILNFQDHIRHMNAIMYDKIVTMLRERLYQLINDNTSLNERQIDAVIELFEKRMNLPISSQERDNIVINKYLKKKTVSSPTIIASDDYEKYPQIMYESVKDTQTVRIKIDVVNPLHPQPYVELKAHGDENEMVVRRDVKCQHEIEWKELEKIKKESIKRYNDGLTDFMERFAIQTREMDFICKVCANHLPMKQFVQDGTFDDSQQKFITSYLPTEIALEDMNEYKRYEKTIKYLDRLIDRVSLITRTTMMTGNSLSIRQKRKAMVKSIIDIIYRHNSIMMKSNINDEQRLEYYSKQYGIDKDLSTLFFFELEDSIFNFSQDISNIKQVELNRLKFNNVLLYFILSFIVEFNGSQIATMYYDNIANIYTYLNPKYGAKLFEGLKIRQNINSNDVVPLANYPVLGYLLFTLSYFLIKYKLWYYPDSGTKSFNPLVQKSIINTFIDMLNNISTEAGKHQNDNIYGFTTSKFYMALNSVFKNTEIVTILKQHHAKYSGSPVEAAAKTNIEVKTYSMENLIPTVVVPGKLMSYKPSKGVAYPIYSDMMYDSVGDPSTLTTCPSGSPHVWEYKSGKLICGKCKANLIEVSEAPQESLFIPAYYYVMQKIAQKRCLDGNIHDFQQKDSQYICKLCSRNRDTIYTEQQLDELADSLRKNQHDRASELIKIVMEDETRSEKFYENVKEEMSILMKKYMTDINDKIYGGLTSVVSKFIKMLEQYLGSNINLGIDKYPVYLTDDVYVIDHAYNGSKFEQPFTFSQKDGKVVFRENHPYFQKDVYTYVDNRSTHIDVFYDAITLRLLGYKEKHKDYILNKYDDLNLRISKSIRYRLLSIGYSTQYINIEEIMKESGDYYESLDAVIKEHILKVKSAVDKFFAIVSRVKYYRPKDEVKNSIDLIGQKYSKLIKDLSFPSDSIFVKWRQMRGFFQQYPVDWQQTTVKANNDKIINSDLITYYDVSSSFMLFYLVNSLTAIMDNNKDQNSRVNIAQMFVEAINNIYNEFNSEEISNNVQVKRFKYILNGSEVVKDMLRKGEAVELAKKLESQLEALNSESVNQPLTEEEKEEADDLKEEDEGLDVEVPDYLEENEDYNEGNEYEE